MISLFRDFTKSWIFTALMALLIASFAVFGLRDVFGSAGLNSVVTAGDRKVTSQQFKTQFDNYKTQQAQQNNGQSITNEDFVKSGLYLQMLDAVAGQTAFSAWLDQLGVKATPKMVVQQLAQGAHAAGWQLGESARHRHCAIAQVGPRNRDVCDA